MCGIVGYTGKRDAAGILLGGLRRLEYRGYDSAGLAVCSPGGLSVVKAVGRVEQLSRREHPRGVAGIGHTRWATHGRPSEANAHPHTDCSGDFAVVHNGIIENYGDLREELETRGHLFRSETDTEVIAHLIEEAHRGDLTAATREALARLEGSYAIAVVSNREPGAIVAARQKSPLLIGLGSDGNLLASDATAVLEHTNRVIYLIDGETARLDADGVRVFDPDGKPVTPVVDTLTWSLEDAEKGGFEHFMLKEIHEIPRALHELLRGRLTSLDSRFDVEGGLSAADLAAAQRILVLACGTSYHAGLIGKALIERLAGVPVDVQLASEYRYGTAFPGPRTLAICVSQSGETADTLEALRKAHLNDHRTLAMTNVVGSTITREADGVFHLRAGPEIGVAATKTFVNSVVAFYLLALHLGAQRRRLPPADFRSLVADVKALPRLSQQTLDHAESVRFFAEKLLVHAERAFFLGRQLSHGVALEAALKLKEISYVHAEGYAAGELKHGPLALLEEGVPVIACVARDPTYAVMLSNIGEVRARGAHVLAIVDESNVDIDKYVNGVLRLPSVNPLFFPVPTTVALYLLAYYSARARGCEIDKPRNLAKSVTVE